jgi:hypothetical protein
MIFWATPSCGPSVCLDQWIGLSDGVMWSDGPGKKGNSKIPNDLQLCDGGSNVLFLLFLQNSPCFTVKSQSPVISKALWHPDGRGGEESERGRHPRARVAGRRFCRGTLRCELLFGRHRNSNRWVNRQYK